MNWRHLISPVLHLYWRTLRPQTYGVRALILHPDTSNRVLLVRHTYGDRMLWNLPGGGFNPKKETAARAAIREVKEELGIDLINPIEICSYYTDAQGKCDTVTIVRGDVRTDHYNTNREISEYCWMGTAEALNDTWGVAKVARHAISSLRSHHCTPSEN